MEQVKLIVSIHKQTDIDASKVTANIQTLNIRSRI